jgi:nicotinate-nucleotide adenylyltransferase
MNIALFGGTFDPIHRGHLAVARAAQQRFGLKRVYFVPANVPPHKQGRAIASYYDRFAMVALATAGENSFVASPLEAPELVDGPSYSINTVRRLRQRLKQSDRLFFLLGIDAFLGIATWHDPEALLHECEFVVASRPGYSLADVARALPDSIRPAANVTKPFEKQPAKGDIVLRGTTIHLLDELNESVSATGVRDAVARGRGLEKLVGPAVAEYVKKTGLYQAGRTSSAPARKSGGLRVVAGRRARAGRAEEE